MKRTQEEITKREIKRDYKVIIKRLQRDYKETTNER